MDGLGVALLLPLLGAGLAAGSVRAADAEDLHDLFQERYAWELREYPDVAMTLGDYSGADRLTNGSLEAIQRRHRRTLAHQRRLEAIDLAKLQGSDLVSYELFKLRLHDEIEDHRFGIYLMPLGQRYGPHQTIAEMAEGIRFDRVEDYENYILRLRQTPKMVDDAIAVMKRGLAEGRTPPKVALLGVPAQLETLLAPGGLDALASPLESMPSHLRAKPRATYPIKFKYEALPEVETALGRFQTFVVDEYLPGCRESIAATSLPNGAAFYAHQLRKMTTTDMTAQEIHKLGLSEVARIRGEMMDVIRGSDYLELHPERVGLDDAALFAGFIEYLRTDPRFYYDRPEDLLAGYRDICKRVDAWLPKLFGTLPRLPYGVREIPAFVAPYTTTAYYSYGSPANGEPGWFYANTYALDQRPKYEMVALAIHEAVPGHHLQVALANELENVPDFRKRTWFTAFGEGWALYSERLGIEMGLYEDPYDDFGRLLYEMWRACRLVVDPGMHALDWSREQAIAYMRENTALSELNIVTEVDRYIAWPGQATAYKIGELRFRELRRLAEGRLGPSFDIRAYHDVVLGAGSVPLDVVERRVRRWIRSQPAGAMYD